LNKIIDILLNQKTLKDTLATKNEIISMGKPFNTPVTELKRRIEQVFTFLKSIQELNGVNKLTLAEEQVNHILKEIEKACNSSQL
jgi:SPX domain protein involved in polyphosphate accumulation